MTAVRAVTTRASAAALSLLLTWGCSKLPDGPSDLTIQDFIARVTTLDGSVVGGFVAGAPPGAGGGPSLDATGLSSVINGGSAQVTLTGSATFSRVFISVTDVEGYWEVDLSSQAAAVITLVLTLRQEVPLTSFTCVYSVTDAAGNVGAPENVSVTVTEVGTGQVQVSVSWDAASDVDLHVVDPAAEEVYFGNRTSQSGGELDLDSNAACSIDNVNNENITWQSAPRGEYIVRVEYWAGCGVEQTNYVVTVAVAGRQAQTFTGSFTGDGTQGGQGAGTEITRFTF